MSYWLSRWWLLEWLIREVRAIERVTHWPERGSGGGWRGGKGIKREMEWAWRGRERREDYIFFQVKVDSKEILQGQLKLKGNISTSDVVVGFYRSTALNIRTFRSLSAKGDSVNLNTSKQYEFIIVGWHWPQILPHFGQKIYEQMNIHPTLIITMEQTESNIKDPCD